MGRSALIAAAAAAAVVITTIAAAADALSFPEGTETSTVSLGQFNELTNGACTERPASARHRMAASLCSPRDHVRRRVRAADVEA